MKRNNIYLRLKLSEKELSLLKFDLIDNSVHFVLKIKNLNLDKSVIEEVVKNAVEHVIDIYKFGSGGRLGDLVKTAVIADLRAYYENTYPDQANKVSWPDLDKKKPFDRLVEILQKVKLQPIEMLEGIFDEVNGKLSDRQQDILFTIFNNPFIPYAEISKLFGKRGVMTYKQIQIIYAQLIQTLKDVGIGI